MPEHGFPPHDFDIGFIHPCTVSLAVGLPVPIQTFHQSLANITLPRFVPDSHPGYHQFMRTSFPG